MKVYSFPRGGFIHNDITAPQKSNAVSAFLPALSVIPLGEGKRKVFPVVSVGEIVKEGMIIGRSSGPGTVNIHSTVPGRIVRKISWSDKEGFDNEAFIIRMEGTFEKLGRKEEIFPWAGLTGYDLQRIITEHGIVEMEHPGRPLSEMIYAARKVHNRLTLVVRCILDDPWLVADFALCKDRINAVIEGASIVAKACLKVSHIIIAVSYREKDLGEELVNEASRLEIPSSMVLTNCRYPQRSRRELELALRVYEKKEGLNLGTLMILGPSVLAAAYDAVAYKKPVLERYVAVGGSAVKNPQIMKVRIGTRIGELIDQCGGITGKLERVIIGSPLCGREIMYLDEPVDKTCYAIAAMTKSQSANHKQQNCINCGECRKVCPVGLDPQNIYKRIKARETENLYAGGCHGCGCCKVVCPSALPLVESILQNNYEEKGA